MLENAFYSVISTEGCATILWRDPKKMLDAAKAMKLSAKDLLKLKVIDEIISEPVGAAHRNPETLFHSISNNLKQTLKQLSSLNGDELKNMRKKRFLDF